MNSQKPGKLFFTVLAFFAALGLGVGKAQATVITNGCANVNMSCSLDELIAGGSITVRDKLFDNFEIEPQIIFSKPVDPLQIDVTGLDDQPNNPGLKFTALNNALTADLSDFIDFRFNFKVTALDPSRRLIKDASLALTDFTLDLTSDGLIQIEDTVFDPIPNLLGDLFVEADAIFGNTLTDSVDFAPQSMVLQEINIFVDSGFAGSPTGINMFEVRKSQIKIPEPVSLSLLVIGLVGFGLMKRRKEARG